MPPNPQSLRRCVTKRRNGHALLFNQCRSFQSNTIRQHGELHEQDRRQLARQSKTATKELTDVMWQRHRLEFSALRDRQTTEHHAQAAKRESVSFGTAKATLAAEHETAARPIHRAPEPGPARQPKEAPSVAQPFTKAADPAPAAPLSRAEQIKRDMDEWKKRNPDRDHGREL